MNSVIVPAIIQPQAWNIVFDRKAESFIARFVPGKFKHVRAYCYVSGMHIWMFIDPHFRGIDIFFAQDGAHINILKTWLADSEQITVVARASGRKFFPLGFWCVTAIKHLLGLRCVAATPIGLYRWCLDNGGIRFEDKDGRTEVRGAEAVARSGLPAPAG